MPGASAVYTRTAVMIPNPFATPAVSDAVPPSGSERVGFELAQRVAHVGRDQSRVRRLEFHANRQRELRLGLRWCDERSLYSRRRRASARGQYSLIRSTRLRG